MKVGTVFGMFGCDSVQEKARQNPDMHALPSGA